MLHASGLVDFYKTDKEGKDRLENLEELVNAAEAFVTQEGFGKDAVALPVDEQGAAVEQVPDAETGEIMSPLAAFLTHASLEAGDNQAQAGQDAIQLMTVHSAKGLEFDCGVHHRAGRRPVPARELPGRPRRAGRRAAPDVRGHHARAQAPVPELQPDAHAARADALQRQEPLLRRAARGRLKWITPRNQGFGSGFAREYQQAWQRGSGLGSIVGAGRVEPRPASSYPSTRRRPRHRTACAPGQSVFHTKFGEGVIVTLEGSGEDARAQVNFGRHGMKWLALSVAKLTPVN